MLTTDQTPTLARIRDLVPTLAGAPVATLDTPEREAKAADLLRILTTLDKDADEERKARKEPHLRAGQAVDEEYRQARAPLQALISALRQGLARAAQERETRRLEALQAITVAVQAQDAAGANSAALAAREVETSAPATPGVSERWTWEVATCVIAQVPEEFLALDLAKVREAIRAADKAGAKPEIRGLTFTRVAAHTVRTVRAK